MFKLWQSFNVAAHLNIILTADGALLLLEQSFLLTFLSVDGEESHEHLAELTQDHVKVALCDYFYDSPRPP